MGYPHVCKGQVVQFAVRASGWIESLNRFASRALTQAEISDELDEGRYLVSGTVFDKPEGLDYEPSGEAVWEEGGNCVLDLGILCFASLQSPSELAVGDAVVGSIDFHVHFAEFDNNPCLIYTWRIKEILDDDRHVIESTKDTASPCLLRAERLDALPRAARNDYVLILEAGNSERADILDALSQLAGISTQEAASMVRNSPARIMSGMTGKQFRQAASVLRQAGIKFTFVWSAAD